MLHLDRRGLVLQNRAHQTGAARSRKRRAAGEHFVEDRAEREDVASRVGLLPLDLFGRHVLKRPENRSLFRDRRRRGRHHRRAAVGDDGMDRFCEAEVEQLGDRPIRRSGARDEEDVSRLQIAMDDARAVRTMQRLRDLRADRNRLVGRPRTSLQTIGERLAFEKLHDEEADARRRVADRANRRHVPDVVQRADMRVIERGDRPRFALEPFAELRIRCERRRQDFDRDDAIQPGVAGLVDLAHAARTEQRTISYGPRRAPAGSCKCGADYSGPRGRLPYRAGLCGILRSRFAALYAKVAMTIAAC